MVHGESAVAIAVPVGIAGRKSENPQRRTSAFPARSVRNPAFGVGIFLGVCFSGIGLAWLLLANRVPYLDPFAGQRRFEVAEARDVAAGM